MEPSLIEASRMASSATGTSASASTATARLDCASHTTREINIWLKEQARLSATAVANGGAPLRVCLSNPDSRHNLAVGLLAPLDLTIHGPVGYYCGGLCKGITLTIEGSAGWGLAENLMAGRVTLTGNAGSSAGATMRGGTLVVHGDSGARTAAAMKGGTLVVGGDVGAMTAFMMQKGVLIVGGNAGEGLGDSLYEGKIFLRGDVDSLGSDAQFVQPTPADLDFLAGTLQTAGMSHPAEEFRLVESARRLYNFDAKEKEIWRQAL